MKKGNWQQDHGQHIEFYGNSFMDAKYFDLKIEQHIIDDYIKPLSLKLNGVCDIFEFGVYTGGSLKGIANQIKDNNISIKNIWGFDSFEGLPKETEGMQIEGQHWNEGAFSACDALNVWDWKDLEKQILTTINDSRAKLIKGFYNDVLNSHLIRKFNFNPAIFINIDVDLYRSTIEVLSWLFENSLLVAGSVIRYDDVNFIPETAGELQAHADICNKYRVSCKRLNKQYFVIESIS